MRTIERSELSALVAKWNQGFDLVALFTKPAHLRHVQHVLENMCDDVEFAYVSPGSSVRDARMARYIRHRPRDQEKVTAKRLPGLFGLE